MPSYRYRYWQWHSAVLVALIYSRNRESFATTTFRSCLNQLGQLHRSTAVLPFLKVLIGLDPNFMNYSMITH